MKRCCATIVLLGLLVGCGQTQGPNEARVGTNDKTAKLDSARGMSVDSSDSSTVSDDTPITVETPPETICRVFLDCLRNGEHSKAEKFLSQESIAQTRKQSLDLAMPAGKDAQYTISPPMYATSQQKIAFVSIGVSDPTAATSPPGFSMMLKNGSFGWKIAGILFGADEATQDLYSFENPLDVLRIKSMLDGDARQARVEGNGGEIRRP